MYEGGKMPHYTQSGKGCKFEQQIEVEIGYWPCPESRSGLIYDLDNSLAVFLAIFLCKC